MTDAIQPPPPAAPQPPDRGSLPLGFALGWAVPIVGYICVGTLAGMASSGSFILLLLCLPWIATAWLIVHFYTSGKPRTGKGMLIGLAAMVAAILLLVAACFSLLSSSGFH